MVTHRVARGSLRNGTLFMEHSAGWSRGAALLMVRIATRRDVRGCDGNVMLFMEVVRRVARGCYRNGMLFMEVLLARIIMHQTCLNLFVL